MKLGEPGESGLEISGGAGFENGKLQSQLGRRILDRCGQGPSICHPPLAVPATSAVEAAGHAVTEATTAEVSKTCTMIEAVTHAMAETVVAAVPDIISTIGQIAVGEVGVVVVGTAVGRVGH
jgi:hypothetical protein